MIRASEAGEGGGEGVNVIRTRNLSALKKKKKMPGDQRLTIAIARASFGSLPLASFVVSYKPCAILAASWWVSGDGQCRDETQ
jgi:hypothetical protein